MDNNLKRHKKYYNYLRQRSKTGELYRRLLLYPKIDACLEGEVLDFGCGIGDFLKFRAETVGIDHNPFNVEFCRSQGLKAERPDEEGNLPFQDNTFAGVVMDNVIEHIPVREVEDVLDELLRVLIPEGRLLIGIPGRKGFRSDPDHKCFYTETSLVELLDSHGFRRIRSFHMPLHLPALGEYLSQYCIYVLFSERL